MKKCRECNEKNKIINFNFNCLEKKRCVFLLYDYRLAEVFFEYFNIKISEEELKQLSSKIQESFFDVRQKIESLKQYLIPKNKEEFLSLLKQLNLQIFAGTKIELFGKFRKNKIYFDTDQHEMQGSEPDKIQENLENFYTDYLVNFIFENREREKFLRICALFLETFFRIHPFPDGNGRVARLFLIILGLTTKNFIFERFDSMHGQDDNDYIKALRYAHKYYNHSNLKKRGNAHSKLIEWLGSKLSDKSEFTGAEEEPFPHFKK